MGRLLAVGFVIAACYAALPDTNGQVPAAKAPPGKAPASKGQARPAAKSADADPTRAADVDAIQQSAAAFAAAYNAHDAKAISELFTTNGEIVDQAGDAQRGRSQIEAVFRAAFDEFPEATISVTVGSVRFLGPNVAQEEGTTSVVQEPGGTAESGRYLVVHMKQDGKWLMASARELNEHVAVPGDKLEPLSGLIGDWIDESPDSLIVTSYRWTDNHSYILGQFDIRVAGRPVMSGSQRIGWDPLAKVIRSWVFDSEGGFAEGLYSQDGDRWIIKLSGVTRDGEPATATNVIRLVDSDRMTWQSRDRTVGARAQPDTAEVIVVRPPPSPE